MARKGFMSDDERDNNDRIDAMDVLTSFLGTLDICRQAIGQDLYTVTCCGNEVSDVLHAIDELYGRTERNIAAIARQGHIAGRRNKP